jgi:hypothetical protein
VKQLRDRYDTAFKSWTVEMKRLHDLRAQAGEGADVDGAEVRTTAAETTYRETRDQLAEEVANAACA